MTYAEAQITMRRRWSRKTDSRDYIITAIVGDRITLERMITHGFDRADITISRADLLRKFYPY